MSSVFRIQDEESLEVSDSWELAKQIEAVDAWLFEDANSRTVRGAVLDIGFNSRLGSPDVAMQGETVPLEFMRRLVDNNITLWLSIYPPFDEDLAADVRAFVR